MIVRGVTVLLASYPPDAATHVFPAKDEAGFLRQKSQLLVDGAHGQIVLGSTGGDVFNIRKLFRYAGEHFTFQPLWPGSSGGVCLKCR